MSYTPKTEEYFEEEELKRQKELLLPDGIYDFEVADAESKKSSKGNDMYVLILTVYDETGATQKVYDYITFGNNYGERKFRHAAVACKLMTEYEAGNLTVEDFTGRSGKVEITLQEGNKEYPKSKNMVKDYLAPVDGEAVKPKIDKSVEDDACPF